MVDTKSNKREAEDDGGQASLRKSVRVTQLEESESKVATEPPISRPKPSRATRPKAASSSIRKPQPVTSQRSEDESESVDENGHDMAEPELIYNEEGCQAKGSNISCA